MFATKPKIAILSGSNRENALTRLTLMRVEELAKNAGLEVEVFCARALDLPVFDTATAAELPNAQRFRQGVKDAVGVIVGSPEYHGSFSGAVKNMIDYLDYAELEGKPIGLVVAAGGPKSGIGTLNALRIVFRSIRAPVIIEQAAVWGGDFDAETLQLLPDAAAQVGGVVNGLAREIALRAPRPIAAKPQPTATALA